MIVGAFGIVLTSQLDCDATDVCTLHGEHFPLPLPLSWTPVHRRNPPEDQGLAANHGREGAISHQPGNVPRNYGKEVEPTRSACCHHGIDVKYGIAKSIVALEMVVWS
jgi:hypothetical protein